MSQDVTPRPALALFDFDGTLTTTESFPAFLRMVVPKERLLWGSLLVAPLVLAYRLRLLSGNAVRAAILRVAARGLDVAAVEAMGQRYAREIVPTTLRPQMLERLRWHRDRGDTIVVVTGTFDLCLRAWCETEGIALLASTLELREGRLTGRYAGPQCAGDEKVRRVRAVCDPAAFARVYAYGDTVEDLPMLALADEAVYRGQRVAAPSRVGARVA